MTEDQGQNGQEHKDFFISYTNVDRQWAEWIAFELEVAGYHTIIQAWDFRPGSNFVVNMDVAAKQADRTLLVLSAAYVNSEYTFSEWATAFRSDPKGMTGRLLPIRVQPCEVDGLLGSIMFIDLVDLDEGQAREQLLAGVVRKRVKPTTVSFPGLNRPIFPGELPPIWNVPYPQNPLFIGREELLSYLSDQLLKGQSTITPQPQAMSGLGGIGKTQIALEYAYRHRNSYQAVLWVYAETRDTFASSYLTLATWLNLPEKDERESGLVVTAVKNWLQRNTGWLLILDNADDLTLVRDFLPPSFGGHILMTTRASVMGRIAHRLEVDILPTEEGTLFLLRRAGLLATNMPLEQAPEEEQNLARAISEELGGLPLALDQAGAYIEETSSSLAAYQALYRTRKADLLRMRGDLIDDHPEPVATTWSLSFQRVEEKNPAAAELLRFCAFLHPDSFPEEIILYGAASISPALESLAKDPIALDKAIALLNAYSLLHRDSAAKTLSVHRLVQAVLQDTMDEQTRRYWVEHTVLAVNAALPHIEYTRVCQERCEHSISHAQVSTIWIGSEGLHMSDAAATLLHFVSW